MALYIKILTLLLALAALAFFYSIAFMPNSFAADELCPTIETIDFNVRRNAPEADFIILEAPKAAAYMAEFNAVPPVSTYPTPEQLMVITAPDQPDAVFLVGCEGGCLVGHFSISRELHQKLMRMIIGPET